MALQLQPDRGKRRGKIDERALATPRSKMCAIKDQLSALHFLANVDYL